MQTTKIYIVSSSIDSVDLERAKSYSVVSKYIVIPFSEDKVNELIKDIEKCNL